MAGFAGSSGPQRVEFDAGKVVRALSFTGSETVSGHASPFSSWIAVTHKGEARQQEPVYLAPGIALALHGYITGVEGRRGLPARGALALCADLYREEGLSFAKRLNGSFALAIEDLADGALHLVSDRLGTRNVYLHLSKGRLSFATRLEAIRRVNPSIADKVDGAALAVFLAFGRPLGPTMLEGVRMLPSACALTYDGAALEERRYWKPSFSYSANRLSFEENARRLCRAVDAAAADSVRGWDSIGLLLSGGLDSRMVLSSLEGHDVTCYTACDRRNLETRVAEKVARRAGAAHVKLFRNAYHYLDIVPQAVRLCEGGYEYDHAHLEGLWEAFGDCEDRAILSGFGMNSVMRTFFLSDYDASLHARSRHGEVARGLDSVEAVEERLSRFLECGHDALAVMAPTLRHDAAGYPREVLRRFLARYESCCESPVDLLDLIFFAHLGRTRVFPFVESLRQRFPERCPALDNRVVAVALSTPPRQRFDSRISRRALTSNAPRLALLVDANSSLPAALGGNAASLGRKALRFVERVPAAVNKRLSRHEGLWLQKAGSWHDTGLLWRWSGIHERLEALLEDEAAMRDGLINADGVRCLLRNHLEGKGYHHFALIRVLSFLAWRRSWA